MAARAAAGLMLAATFVLTACGGAGGGQQGSGSGGGEHGMAENGGMDHDQMGHGSMGMGSGGMAKQMVMENGKYSDEAFIDAMVPHHQGAIAMAKVALKNAEHEEIKELSRNIVSTQQAEIEELKAIKKEEFGTSDVPMEMSSEQMRGMGMMMDPQAWRRGTLRRGVHRRHDPSPPVGHRYGDGGQPGEREPTHKGARREHRERPEGGDRADEALAGAVVPRKLGSGEIR